MKIAVLIARILLGLVFLIFGSNLLHPFLPMPPMPPSDAATYQGILFTHHFLIVVGLIQFVGGVLLLVGRYVPLALTLLGPVIVNILLFHLLLTGGGGIAPGLFCTLLEIFLIWAYRLSFRGLFDATPEVS